MLRISAVRGTKIPSGEMRSFSQSSNGFVKGKEEAL